MVFTLEMLIKWIALGFFGPTGYFTSMWNVVDFVIVVTGYVPFLSLPSSTAQGRRRYTFLAPETVNVSAIRVLRVLRPLRTINKLRGLRVLTKTFLRSLTALLDVSVLVFFLLCVYAIIGVQVFRGERCAGEPRRRGRTRSSHRTAQVRFTSAASPRMRLAIARKWATIARSRPLDTDAPPASWCVLGRCGRR